jgi:tetratricopeptide (TPR) repeat protein
VNTGLVLAGRIGSAGAKSLTVMGDAVNLASRLKDLAPPGSAYVGQETRNAARAEYRFRELDPVKVKGKDKPVPLFELLGPAVEGMPASSAFVGRAVELSRLEASLRGLRSGRGFVALVSGEPGIGKSRLLDELKARDHVAGLDLLEGRAIAQGRQIPYHPFASMLRSWAGIGEEDGDAKAFALLKAAVESLIAAEAPAILPFAARVAGIEPDVAAAERLRGIEGDALERLVFSKMRALVSAFARRSSTLIIIEDIHWADATSLELLVSLTRLAESQAIGFILTSRPEPAESGSATMAAFGVLACFSEIRIESLGAQESGELVDRLVGAGEVPFVLRAMITERSGGNPYFIEEVVRSLVEEGAVAKGSAGREAAAKPREVLVPTTISDLITARMDRLDEATRDLMRAASVIGRSFTHRLLSQVTLPAEGIDSGIGRLVGARLVVEEEGAAELEYLFKHALAQEVAYESILLQRRRELHKATAEAIERLFPDRLDELSGMLAYHYGKAELPDKAEEYMLRAGESASRAAASNEAIVYYSRALDLYLAKRGGEVDPARVAMLERKIARSLYFKGRFGECIPRYEKLLAKYPDLKAKRGPALAIDVARGLASCIGLLFRKRFGSRPLDPGGLEGYSILYEYMMPLSQVSPLLWSIRSIGLLRVFLDYDITGCRALLLCLSGLPMLFGYTGISLRLSGRVLDIVSRYASREDPVVYAGYRNNAALHALVTGDWIGYAFHDSRMIEAAVADGEVMMTFTNIWADGIIRIERGETTEAAACLEELEDLDREFDSEYVKDLRSLLRCRLLSKLGRWDELRAEIDAMLAFFGRTELKPDHASALAFKARMHRAFGELEAAARALDAAYRLVPASEGFTYDRNTRLGASADLALAVLRQGISEGQAEGATGRPSKRAAKRAARKAVGVYVRVSRRCAVDVVESLKLAGHLAWQEGSPRRAERSWRKAIAEGERLGARLELGRTLAEAGALLGSRDPGPEWVARGAELAVPISGSPPCKG